VVSAVGGAMEFNIEMKPNLPSVMNHYGFTLKLLKLSE